MAKSNLHTPDRELNPPDDKWKDCIMCKGTGKVFDYPNETDDVEDDSELINCDKCKGEGVVECENWEDEW